MKSWLIVGVILLLLPFVVANSCQDTCFSLGFDYGLCEAVSEEQFCTEGEEDIGILSCDALERCCCGFDDVEEEVEVEIIDETTEEEEVEESVEEDLPIVLEPIMINSAPIVKESSTEVEVGDTAILTIEVKNNYLSYWFATVFRTKENVFIYDADGDDLYFSIEGDSGFVTDLVYEYEGVYALGWIVDEDDVGVYTDTIYVWDDQHVDDVSAATFITYVGNVEDEEEFILDVSEEEEDSFWDNLFEAVDDEPETEEEEDQTEEEEVEEEEPVIEVTIVDSTDDTEEEEVYVNKAPKVDTKDINGIVDESVVLSVEVKENWFTYFWANLFRVDHNIYVYDKEGDGIYFRIEGESGFASDGEYVIYSGTYSLDWVPEESGVYTDSVYVWDDGHVNSSVVSTFTLTIDEIVEEPVDDEPVINESAEPANDSVVSDEIEMVYASTLNYLKFLATVLLILIVVLLLIYVLIPKKKESLFE
tara:strand:- start:5018 stop:6445 length:1428 start_codon:yes stop_codon:yes gene_type:complete